MRRLAPAALIVLVLFAFPSVGREEPKADIFSQLNLLGDVIERVRSDYVEPVNDEKMIEAAINGMLASLDPHSSYMNAKSYRDMQVQTRGEFGGLGIQVTMDTNTNLIKVISPIDDTPAAKAGIKAGDYVTALDGESVVGMTLNDAVEKMRGPVNSTIKLTIARPGTDKPFDVSITREIIQIKPVTFRAERDVGYIRISSFNEQTDDGVKEALTKLPQEIGPDKLRGYILDLRDNPGGLLDQAIAVSDDFLDHGEIVSTRGRRPEDTQRYNAKPGDLAHGKPMIVLINGGSASASEIVSGALQDHRRAVIVGTRSFGKGSVQTIIPLGTHGALRLTTARYYTPAERSIQAKGIEPDVVVAQAKVEPIDQGQRLSEADLRGHLAAPPPVDAGSKNGPSSSAAPKSGATKSDAGTQKDDVGTASDTNDYQLSYALDLLRGIALATASKEN